VITGADDRFEELADLLSDDGVSRAEVDEVLESMRCLSAADVMAPTSAETESLVRSLEPFLGTPGALLPARASQSARRRPAELVKMLRLAALQVSVLHLGFWVSSAVVMLVGLGLAVSQAGADRAYVLALVGPLLAYLGVSAGFRGDALGMLEVEFACPVTVRELTVARLLVIVAYQTLVGATGVILLHGAAGSPISALMSMWLAPLLLGLGSTLLLSLWLTPSRAGAFVYSTWVVMVTLAWRFGDGAIVGRSVVELAVAAAGVAALALAVGLLPGALSSRLPKGTLGSS
jgi:hypothetical protein